MKKYFRVLALSFLILPCSSFASPSISPNPERVLEIGVGITVAVGIGFGVWYLLKDEPESNDLISIRSYKKNSNDYSFKYVPLMNYNSSEFEGIKLEFNYLF